MRKNRIFFLFSLVLALMLVLAACAGDGEPEDTGDTDGETGEDATETTDGEGGDLIITIGADVVSLSTQGSNDVPSSNVGENIYETLVVLDENQEIQPGLAESWEEVDETTWEFTLHEGVTFHDGEPFNAEAVVTNFDRLVDPDIASPRAFLLDAVESVEAVDELTLQINLEYPYSPILSNLTHSGAAMMSPAIIEEDYAAIEEDGDPDAYINQNPVGTGPFVFDSWTPGESVVLTNNEDYWGDNAKLDSVTFKVVDEQSTRIAELETNESHVVDAIGPNNVSRVEGMADADVLIEPSLSLSYVGFNVQKEPFDDERVRQAISMAIDKEEIIDGVYDGNGTPAVGPLAPGVFGFDENVSGIEHDLEEAQALLAEAGYEDGFETTIWTNDSEERVDTAIAIQSQLDEIGITVEIEELEWGAYLERTAAGEHDMYILGWSTVTSDADYGMYPLFHSASHGDPGNRSFLDDEEVDELLDAGREETDADARQEIYSEAQELLVDLAPMLYIHHQDYLLGVNESVNDFGVDAQGIYQLRDAYISE